MFLVKWKNLITGRNGSPKFKSEEAATEFVQKHLAKETFGKKARQAIKGQDQYDQSLVLSEFEDTDEDGSVRTIVSLKAEFEYSIEEITEIGNSAESKKLRLKNAQGLSGLVKKKKDFGEMVASYFSGLITVRGLTKQQKKQLRKNNEIKSILDELRLGAIEDALEEMDALVMDETVLFQEDMDKVKLVIEDFLSGYADE